MILISFIRFRIFQIFYNVCAFLLKSEDAHFLNIDTSILICHVFYTYSKKYIHSERTGKGVPNVDVAAIGSQDMSFLSVSFPNVL